MNYNKFNFNRFANKIQLEQVKLIDYGSTCKFEDLKDIIMSTPEYTAMEINGLILCNYYDKQFEK